MKPEDNVKKSFKKLHVPTSTHLDEKIYSEISRAVVETENKKSAQSVPNIWRIIIKSKITKLAAAAVILVFAGYAIGRFSVSRPLDMKQLHQALEASLKSSLEPTIRQKLVQELNRKWQIELASTYVHLRDELSQQFRRDLNEFAIQTLAASSTLTNQQLTELIDVINAAHKQDRQLMAAVLEQMELNRLQEDTQLRYDLVTFAVHTEDQFLRTKQDVADWIAYGRNDNIVPEDSKSVNHSDERSKK